MALEVGRALDGVRHVLSEIVSHLVRDVGSEDAQGERGCGEGGGEKAAKPAESGMANHTSLPVALAPVAEPREPREIGDAPKASDSKPFRADEKRFGPTDLRG